MCSILGVDSKSILIEDLLNFFSRSESRGPDMSRMIETETGYLGFHRLAIMGLNEAGMQPFTLEGNAIVCNGEIFGFRAVRERLKGKGYAFKSDSDCEVLLPMYAEYGLSMFRMLDAEFALVLYDHSKRALVAARDPIGIRPLFYGYLADGSIIFASEARCLVGLVKAVKPFPPGYYYAGGRFVRYCDLTTTARYSEDGLETVCRKIHDFLIEGVRKRLDADAPLGFL